MTYDEILESCVNGIKTSFNEYKKWSNGLWLWNAPEYLLTVNIAKYLAKVDKPKYITLEDNVRKTLKNANAKIKGSLKQSIRPDGRSDIVVWWAKETPRGIIEVKNSVFRLKKIEEDVNRILGILEKESDIEFGVNTFYIDRHYEVENAAKKVEERVEKIIEELEEISEENDLKYKYVYEEIYSDDDNSAFAVAFMIYK